MIIKFLGYSILLGLFFLTLYVGYIGARDCGLLTSKQRGTNNG